MKRVMIALTVCFSCNIIPSFANEFKCEDKFKTYTSPFISGCQMSFDGKNIIEKYKSFFPDNQVLQLDVCLREPLQLEKAKQVAEKLTQFSTLRAQGDKNYWIVQLQDKNFYANLDQKTLVLWKKLRNGLENYKGSLAKMCP